MGSNPQAQERWLTTGQVARRLGWSDDTIRRRCEDGTISGALRLGEGQWRIPADWLRAILGPSYKS